MMMVKPAADALITFAQGAASPLSIRASALVFVDPRSQQVRDQVQHCAQSSLPLLISGEMGTGKELLARHVHRESGRDGLFVAVSCTALSPRYGDAELFGQLATDEAIGASSRMGWLGSANGGTLYLDEIADLSPTLQRKLLYTLENAEVERVGAAQPLPVDVRVIAASSVDLAKVVAAGRFDAHLYQYLIEGHLQLPPLRERPLDIVAMAEYFLGVYSQRLHIPLPLISDQALAKLLAYPWPGNTRELENVMHFALLESQGPSVEAQDLRLCAPLRAC